MPKGQGVKCLHNMSTTDDALHRLWVKIRRPFVVPQSICGHVDSWETYDMHLAGCSNCGAMHRCQHDSCPLSRNHEGHFICNITGLCTKMLNFSDLEYVETVQPISHHPTNQTSKRIQRPPRLSRKKRFKTFALQTHQKKTIALHEHETEKIHNLITTFVRDILVSDQWTTSNHIEHERYRSKWTHSFTKVVTHTIMSARCHAPPLTFAIQVLRDFKKTTPGFLPVIPDIFNRTVVLMGNTRVPSLASLEDRQILATWCVENIRHHLMMLRVIYPEIVQHSRLRGTVIGLMYLM
jgi:hypothetical protein